MASGVPLGQREKKERKKERDRERESFSAAVKMTDRTESRAGNK